MHEIKTNYGLLPPRYNNCYLNYLSRIQTDKIWCVYSTSEPSRRKVIVKTSWAVASPESCFHPLEALAFLLRD